MPHLYKLFILIFFSLYSLTLEAQIEILPLSELQELRKFEKVDRTDDRSFEYRNYKLYTVASENELNICFDTFALTGNFETLIDNDCKSLVNGILEINQNCIVYNSFSVTNFAFDTLCFTLRSEDGSTIERNIIIKVVKPLTPPIMDDFSHEGPYPNPAIWMDRDVFINNRLANNPPSIGVATFDGLDPFGGIRAGGRGPSDTLTSNIIDLTAYQATSNVYLSYFLQPKGKGIQPLLRDSFIIQFKEESGNWKSVNNFEGISGGSQNNDSPDFTFHAERIGLQYFYDNFQFRFINYSSRLGLENLWHLDYVRVTDSGVPDGSNEDIAFNKEPSYLINTYSAVPLVQFRANPDAYLANTIDIGVYNHFPNRVTVAPSDMRIVERVTGTQIEYFPTLLEVPPIAPVNQRDLDPGFYNFTNNFNNNTTKNNIISIMNDVDALELETIFTLSQSTELGNNFPPTLSNNEVSVVTHISDYFAYDDGTAERVINIHSASGPNLPIAMKFTLQVGDTLRAMDIHFPRYENLPFDPFRIFIWKDDLNSEPIFESIQYNPLYGDEFFREFNSFTTYTFKDELGEPSAPIYLEAGDFYIGWQKIGNAGRIPVGYDTNTDARENTFVRVSGTWQPLSDISSINPGTVMLRPIFGSKQVFGTSTRPSSVVNDMFRVFPNPSSGVLNIELSSPIQVQDIEMEIFNMSGQKVYSGAWENRLDLSALPKGMYLLQLLQTTQNTRQINKIILN